MTTLAQSPADTTAHEAVHGDLDCVDVEALLRETINENQALRARERDQMARIDLLDLDLSRYQALLNDLSKKTRHLAEERDGLDSQVNLLVEELDAAERDAVPVGTLVFGSISTEEMTATYRRLSRVHFGPLPPAVTEAVTSATDTIRDAMTAAGTEAMERVIATAVRRRRAAQRATGRRANARGGARTNARSSASRGAIS